ncbi:MAG: hypothetical protein AAB412_02910 [Elusimicrobiota bacterium]
MDASAGREGAYVVGGALRDSLLGLGKDGPAQDPDLDIACREAKAFAADLARRLKATLVTLDEGNRVYRVVCSGAFKGLQVDVAEIQGAGIEEDLARRDFTVDAMAVPLRPQAEGFFDPFGGLDDLRARVLRQTSQRVFPEDPLRLLRAFRIAALCGLRIEAGTLAAVAQNKRRILKAAAERIRTELLALLGSPASASWLRLMDETGLLTTVFEELEPSRRCAEVYYGKGGVLRHSLDTVARVDFFLEEAPRILGPLHVPVREHLESHFGGVQKHGALLKLIALLHDVAKPECAKRVGGRLRFFGHDLVGAQRAGALLRRLRCSREEEELASCLIAQHLRPGNLAANELVSDKAVYRFFRDLGRRGVSLLLLCWADHASYLSGTALRSILPHLREDPHTFSGGRIRSEDTRKTLRHLQVAHFLLDRYFNSPQTARPERLLDGKAVMRALGIPPGPRVGEVLEKLDEAQAEGRVKDRDSALRFIAGLRA